MLLSSISLALTRLGQRLGRWSPLALWPNGVDSPGMWSSPSTLPASFNDYTGTTPVAPPGSVADSANPVGLALDIRAGAPTTLGPELVVNGDFAAGSTGWDVAYGVPSYAQFINNRLEMVAVGDILIYQDIGPISQSKVYEVSWYQYSPGGGRFLLSIGDVGGWLFTDGTGQKTFRVSPNGTGQFLAVAQSGSSPGDWCDNISVKEIPGHHMLQATSAARPLESARVNLLTYTEDFSFYQYSKNNVTTTGKIITTTGTDNCELGRDTGARAGGKVAFSTTVKKGRSFAIIASDAAANGVAAGFDGTTGAYFAAGSVGSTYSVVSYSCVTDTDPDFWSVGVVFNTGSSVASNCAILVNTNKVSSWGWSGCSGIGDTLEVGTGFQYQLGGTVSPYQPVLADTTYTATGITPFQLYDGVDDGMATAAFAAGTLINGMDCMIAVRRDSAAATYLVSDTGSRGFFEWESGDTNRPDVSAGTPTYYVDGVAVTATRGALFTALTAGDWHILEARGLDLSTWTKVEVSSLVSYRLNGARGDILLYPSTASTADKDAARQYLADKYGVTLA